MVKKNGFISIPIIYSFFVVFLLLLLLMMSSYVNNRFNFNIYKADIKKQFSNENGSVLGTQNFRNYIKGLVTTTSSQTAWKVVYEKGGYRYQGATPRNYVRFNNELWRIIGVFDGSTHKQSKELVKLVRDLPFNTMYSSENTNVWKNTSLSRTLNNNYVWNATSEQMLTEVTWVASQVTSISYTPEQMYTQERVVTANSESNAKVGLIYPSDYAYAVLSTICPRTTLLSGYKPSTGTSNCATLNWLSTSQIQYTLTTSNSNNIMVIDNVGNLKKESNLRNGNYTARPVVYLKENVMLYGGDGSYDNPYTIML